MHNTNMKTDLPNLEGTLLSRTTEDLSTLSADEQFALLKSRAVHIVKADLLQQRLKASKKSGVPLKIKYGIDPTAKDIHLGHVVSVIIARRLQNMGHSITLVIGDFTALVGDPTGRVSTRPILTPDDIEENLQSYTQQIEKFISLDTVTVVRNSEFFNSMSISELIGFFRNNKISPLLQRDDFRKRMDGLSIAEAIYPTFMAIDSVKLQADIELGGNDQLLNFQAAVSFMESEGMAPQSALTTDLLLGTAGDGSKMSKSKNNYVPVSADPNDVFGKIMSIPDNLMEHYFKLLTDITDQEWSNLDSNMSNGDLNPRDVKAMLAHYLTTVLSTDKEADLAKLSFESTFSKHEIPVDIPTFTAADVQVPIIELLINFKVIDTKSQARRLIDQKGIRIIVDNVTHTVSAYDELTPKKQSFIVNIGKRKFFKFTSVANHASP
jgi:tyrosyl-tRNA synthetase